MTTPTSSRPRIGSLFSGAGGLDLAVAHVFGGDIVWHCEVDPAASAVLAAHWPDVPNLGDVSRVDWDALEDVDILAGGFPCQDVSSAGRRAGLKDGSRSGLWTWYADAIDALRPPLVVIENVRGLLSARAHRAGETDEERESVERQRVSDLESDDPVVGDEPAGPVLRAAGAVLGDLADIGYNAVWQVFSAASVGAPHERNRVFILAVPADAGRDRRRGAADAGGAEGARLRPRPQGRRGAGDAGAAAADAAAGGGQARLAEPAPDPRGHDADRRGPQGDDLIPLLLPTPTAAEAGNTPASFLARKGGQRTQVGDLSVLMRNPELLESGGQVVNLPTPLTSDSATPTRARWSPQLCDVVSLDVATGALLPTPAVWQQGGESADRNGGRDFLPGAARAIALGVAGDEAGEQLDLLPTPATFDHVEKRTTYGHGDLTLQGVLGGVNPIDAERTGTPVERPGQTLPDIAREQAGAVLPTPKASDYMGKPGRPWARARTTTDLPTTALDLALGEAGDDDGDGGQLAMVVEHLLPTPQASLGDRRHDQGQDPRQRAAGGHSVSTADAVCFLPTPGAQDGNGGKQRSAEALDAGDHQVNLTDLPRLLPTPAAADAERWADYARAGREQSGGDDLPTTLARGIDAGEVAPAGSAWGKYGPAVARWEAITRPAPAPTEPNKVGNPRLAAAFAEWMMGWGLGWVTAVDGIARNDQLKIIGNGVCPQQAVAALVRLLPLLPEEDTVTDLDPFDPGPYGWPDEAQADEDRPETARLARLRRWEYLGAGEVDGRRCYLFANHETDDARAVPVDEFWPTQQLSLL